MFVAAYLIYDDFLDILLLNFEAIIKITPRKLRQTHIGLKDIVFRMSMGGKLP